MHQAITLRHKTIGSSSIHPDRCEISPNFTPHDWLGTSKAAVSDLVEGQKESPELRFVAVRKRYLQPVSLLIERIAEDSISDHHQDECDH